MFDVTKEVSVMVKFWREKKGAYSDESFEVMRQGRETVIWGGGGGREKVLQRNHRAHLSEVAKNEMWLRKCKR